MELSGEFIFEIFTLTFYFNLQRGQLEENDPLSHCTSTGNSIPTLVSIPHIQMELFQNRLRTSAAVATSAITKARPYEDFGYSDSSSVVLLEMYLGIGLTPNQETRNILARVSQSAAQKRGDLSPLF